MDEKSKRKRLREIFAFAQHVHQQLTELQKKLDDADVLTRPAFESPTYQQYRTAYTHQIHAVFDFLTSVNVTIPQGMLAAQHAFVELVHSNEMSPIFMTDQEAARRDFGENPKNAFVATAKGSAAAAMQMLMDRNIRKPEAQDKVAKALSKRGKHVTGRTVASWREDATSGKNPHIRQAYLALLKQAKGSPDLPPIDSILDGIAYGFARLPKL